MPKVDVPQILISSAAVFGIALVWNDINEKVFRTVYELFRAPLIDKALEEKRKEEKMRGRLEEKIRRRIEEEEEEEEEKERRLEEILKRTEEEKAAGKTD